MNPNTYQQLAGRTAPRPENNEQTAQRFAAADINMVDLTHACIGIATEGGEMADQLKRHLYYGATLDPYNILEECGDVLWYVALALTAIGEDMETAMRINIEKLQARYPEKFTGTDALLRDLDTERAIIEGKS